ncbi:hypothetical protein [Silvibacterium acidisoli]|uniref:hypothetical protein n=1 Tax=Acidobacteriaceae bacterium ZG23-2 TaxID=2883246 RepID=UPI00406D05BE
MKRITHTQTLFAALLLAGLGMTVPAHAASAPALLQDNTEAAAASVAGNWTLSFTAPNGEAKQATLAIEQDGAKLSGSFKGQRGSAALSGSLQGNQVSLSINAHGHQIELNGTLDGDKMSGSSGNGKPWSATRQ